MSSQLSHTVALVFAAGTIGAVALSGCSGVKVETKGGAGGSVAVAGEPAVPGDDAGGESQQVGGETSVEAGAPSTGGKSSFGGTPTNGGASTEGGVAGTSGAAGMGGGAGLGGAAGMGGGGGLGGSGGSATPCNPKPGAKVGDGINKNIDALDDTNTMFTTAGVGQGSWDWSKDSTALGEISPKNTMVLVPVAGGQSGNALHVSGSGVTGWGAQLTAFLNGPTSAFDASKYGGVAFYIKGTTNIQEGTNVLPILAAMPDVLPGPDSCCSDVDSSKACFSMHRVVINVPPDWKEIKIAWSDFNKPFWGLGMGLEFNPNRLRHIGFAFDHEVGDKMNPISFDVWVDGLRFMAADEMSNLH